MKRHLQDKSLEGMSIILCVRWMLFAPLTLGIVVGISAALSRLYPEPVFQTFDKHYFLPLLIVIYFSLVVRDVWIVRRAALSWEESRIRSLTIMQRLPLLLLVLVPVFFLSESPQSTGPLIKWTSGMLWVFSFLSVLFYLIYFVLLFSICRLPKPSAIMGFILALVAAGSGMKERIEEANKPHRATTTSRSVSMIFPDCNPNPVIGARSR